jgi:hypothetical protein
MCRGFAPFRTQPTNKTVGSKHAETVNLSQARAAAAPCARSTNLHPTQLIPEDLRRPAVPATFKKKSVALLVGYVGVAYCGNTTNPVLPRGATVGAVQLESSRPAHSLESAWFQPASCD